MSYRVMYQSDAWVPTANGAPEWRQVVSAALDDGTYLVVVVVRSALSGVPRVAEARIEQPYVTRTAGWKRRTIKRLRPQQVELVAEAEVYGTMRVTVTPDARPRTWRCLGGQQGMSLKDFHRPGGGSVPHLHMMSDRRRPYRTHWFGPTQDRYCSQM